MSKTVEQITLADLPAGSLFKYKGTLALKSEYLTKDGAIEAHIVGSGEMFWGGTHTAEAQRALIVEPYSLPSSPDVAGSDAVAFAVYTSEEGWSKAINEDWWSKSFSSEYCEPLTTSQLYTKFRKERPQPTGATVEQAAVIEALQFCKANLVQAKEYDRAVIIRELEERITSAAAFQAAQGHPAPGIPDVRELVEVVSKVASLNDGSGYVGNLEPLRKAAQTALAGIKGK